MQSKLRIVIIGAGPAGIAAAIQLKRSGYKPIIYERDQVGGLVKNAYKIENYPGFTLVLSGIDLARKLASHLRKYKIPVIKEEVRLVTFRQGRYVIKSKRIIKADILIIASGTRAKLPPAALFETPDKVMNEIFPIRDKRNKNIAVIGAGDAALDYALNLCRRNNVTLINRGPRLKGLSLLQKRLRIATGKKRIRYLRNASVLKVEGHGSGIMLRVRKSGLIAKYYYDHAVFAIGREPALDFLSAELRCLYPGGDHSLYFIGDVVNGDLRQTGIAIGDGIRAAMIIDRLSKT